MSSADLTIGGLTLHLEGGDGVAAAMSLPGMRTFIGENGSAPRLTLLLDAKVPEAEGNERHSFEICDGREMCRFVAGNDGAWYYTFGPGERLRIAPTRPYMAQCTPIVNLDKLRFALWLAYGMMAMHHGRMPVHSSAVVCDGRAVMCLGESGTGKSTHTRLWTSTIEGCHLLNDDSPILAATADGAMLYGSPWSGKTHCYRQEAYPVAALLRLQQRKKNSIRRLKTIEAFAALQPSCPPSLAHDSRTTDIMIDFVGKIISTTPVYLMGCLPNAEAAIMSHNTIYGN